MNNIDKLFTLISPMPSFNSYKEECVTVFWYRADKERDGFQYGEIIKGYNDMTPEDKRLTEVCVNELFTSDEVKALRHFVEAELKGRLIVEPEINLSKPIWEQDYCGPYNTSSADSTIFLNMLKNYNLPFEARGYFNPNLGLPIVKYSTAYDFMKPAKK